MDNLSVPQLLKLAEIFQSSKKFKQAEIILRVAIKRAPHDHKIHIAMGIVLANLEQEDEAIQFFGSALSIRKDADNCSIYSGALIKLRRPDLSVSIAKEGLQMDPDNIVCMYNLNIALRQTGKIAEAIKLSWESVDRRCGPKLSQVEILLNVPTGSLKYAFVMVKWGSKYDAEYVNNLYLAIRRHLPVGFNSIVQFACFTDDPTGIVEEIQCFPFDSSTREWKGWWLKACIFSHDFGEGVQVIYLDLDSVLCGPLHWLLYDGAHRIGTLSTLGARFMKTEGES